MLLSLILKEKENKHSIECKIMCTWRVPRGLFKDTKERKKEGKKLWTSASQRNHCTMLDHITVSVERGVGRHVVG